LILTTFSRSFSALDISSSTTAVITFSEFVNDCDALTEADNRIELNNTAQINS
jgi:hypothetical protein